MQRAGLRAKTRRAFRPCSKASGATGVAENRLEQEFTPSAPNRCWAGDRICNKKISIKFQTGEYYC